MTRNDEDMLIWFEAKRKACNVRQGRRRDAMGFIPTAYYVRQFLLCVGAVALSFWAMKWLVIAAVHIWLGNN